MNRRILIPLSILAVLLFISGGTLIYYMSRSDDQHFSFRILDKYDDTPVSDVEVIAFERRYERSYETFVLTNDHEPLIESRLRTIRSNEDGWVNVTLPYMSDRDGYYVFKVIKGGYLGISGHSILTGPDSYTYWSTEGDERCEIYFNSPANLSGVVTDQSGAPVEGATVSVRYGNYEVDNFDVTCPDGSYSLKNTRSGLTDLTVSGPTIFRNHTSTFLTKFQDNTLDIRVNRSTGDHHNVTLNPIFTLHGEEISVPDGDIAILFMKNNKDPDLEYCWGAAMLQDGKFDLNTRGGRYSLRWMYLGDEDYYRENMPISGDDEYNTGDLPIVSDTQLDIEIRLEPIMDLC